MHKVFQKNVADIIKEHSILAETIERLGQQYAPQKSVEDIQEIKMEHARKQQVPKETITSFGTTTLAKFDQKTTLFETMTKSKSFNKSLKQRALYHALMESILEDEDALDEGFADKLKKRKPDDANKDQGPFAGSNRGLKRQKTSKDTKQFKKAKSTKTSKGTSKSQPKSTGKSAQDWIKKLKRPPTPDPKWNKGKSVENKATHNWLSDLTKAEKPSRTFDDLMSTLIDFSACVRNRLHISELTHDIMVGLAYNILKGTFKRGSTGRTYTTSLTVTKAPKYDLPGIEDMVANLWSLVKVAYDNHALLVTNVKVKEWYGYGHLKEIEVRRSD
ncbi:hypothetical protein Tco_0601750 [Tanacetum coccineum]